MENQEKELLEKLEALEDLVSKQNKALEIANNLLYLKDQLIKVCEEETELYKSENKRLTRSLMISAIFFAIIAVIAVINIIHLLL